jgi:hypothetical protein
MRASLLSRRDVLLAATLTACWAVWSFLGAFAWSLKAPKNITYIVHYTLVDAPIGFIVCSALFALYARLRTALELRGFLFAVLPLCFVGAVSWHASSSLAMWLIGWSEKYTLNPLTLLVGGGVNDGLTLAFFALLFLAVDHWIRLGDERQKARDAAAAANAAQLQMLRYQLNPHFLFNALNSIRAMIVREPERARQIVTELSEFLRYSLNGRGPESTLGEEIEAIDNYIAIQRIRFEEELAVTVRVDPKARDIAVPSFLVHPLVENAVKYGMQTSEPPLRLDIDIAERDAAVVIRVCNTGRLVTPESVRRTGELAHGTGTGLENVRRRLQLAFPDRHSFALTEHAGRVCAEIVLRPSPVGPRVR